MLILSFNPCFNGYYTFTEKSTTNPSSPLTCFNPCFNGYYTFTRRWRNKDWNCKEVSILVLMDITLLPKAFMILFFILNLVSILVLMDITLLHKAIELIEKSFEWFQSLF